MSQRLPAFIVSHGSFNPVHRHHLEMMVRARQCLESAGYEVFRGIMAITPTTRLARKGAEAVTDYHRLEALQIGCDSMLETRGWLAPEPRGVDFGSGGQLVNGLSSELYAQEPQATIFKVIGADVAVRYRGELKGPTVVVCREGSTEAVRAAIHGVGRGRKDLFLVDQLSGEECSSTKIRDALRLQDESVVRRLCPEPVAKYLLDNREGLYDAVPSNWSRAGYPAAAAVAAGSEPLPEVKALESPAATAPAPGPGHGITPAVLRAQWSQTYPSSEVLGFYGHGVKAGYFRCFSNFYDQSQTPFDFVVPPAFCNFAISDDERIVQCDFSEKGIMLCKAAAMGDRESFEAMKAVAFEVVYQKFSKTKGLANVLLGTGCQLIAEATRNDWNWGIGIDVGDPLVQQPSEWRGSNILGWALMETRAALHARDSVREAPSVPSNWSRAGYPAAAAVTAGSEPLPEVKALESPAATAPAPGPGHGITPAVLRAQWSQTYPSSEVLGFYGHGVKAGYFRCFSNFYDQSQTPFDFVVPPAFCNFAISDDERIVQCDFSEKGIMLCKAAAMGDRESFEAMKAGSSSKISCRELLLVVNYFVGKSQLQGGALMESF